jgi:superfamily I DNA and/or RNA helicase
MFAVLVVLQLLADVLVLSVVEMIQNLIQCGLAEEKDIGVITPFYKQIQKIKLLCTEKKLGYVRFHALYIFAVISFV